MDQDLGDITVDQPAELVRRLRTRLSMSWFDVVAGSAADAVPSGLNAVVSSVLRLLLPTAVFRARISGRIPGVGAEFRWAMRQRYVVPRLSVSFPGFGVRLTIGHRPGEKADQVDRLLVHAFLQDLRIAYGRRPWRPGDWRRTSYPVALVDNVSATNGGCALLRLVNDVRNETGQFDPLLIVSASEQAPDDAVAAGSLDFARGAETGHQTWEQLLPEARRRLDRWGWYLPISVPEPSGGRLRPLPIAPDRPPWWARRVLPVILGAAVLLTAGGLGAYQQQTHCGAAWLGGRVDVQVAGGGECIGFSDNASYVFRSQAVGGEADLMLRLQTKIFELNQEAERLHAAPENAGLPLITLIYLAQLTIPVVNTAIAADEREELEGIAIRQNRLLNQQRPQRAPLLKVVLANAGSNMHYAPQVVDMLRPLVASDPSIVGVLGFDESRDETVQAIVRLNELGLPMIAPTLSADGLDKNSQLYFQLGAPNKQEAEMMAQYVASEGLRQARVFYTESPGDLYTRTLRQDLVGSDGALSEHGIATEPAVDWKANNDSAVGLVCGYPGAIFYAGRAEDFDQFLQQMKSTCGDAQPVHPIVADDSVSRFMASRQERQASGAAYPLVYASKAGITSCTLTLPVATAPTWNGFITQVAAAPWYACDQGGTSDRSLGPMGERVALAYDATDAYLRAVQTLGTIPISRGAIWQGLSALPPFDGISGRVDFSSRVQNSHWMALMAVNQVNDVPNDPKDPARVVFHCGWASGRDMGPHPSAACTG
jgi:ABC-type branched-subunit amino acid transport system substrate-binding protein